MRELFLLLLSFIKSLKTLVISIKPLQLRKEAKPICFEKQLTRRQGSHLPKERTQAALRLHLEHHATVGGNRNLEYTVVDSSHLDLEAPFLNSPKERRIRVPEGGHDPIAMKLLRQRKQLPLHRPRREKGRCNRPAVPVLSFPLVLSSFTAYAITSNNHGDCSRVRCS